MIACFEGHGQHPPWPELINRARLARWLNAVNGTTRFHAWNVGDIPDVDLEVLQAWQHYEAQYREEVDSG